MFSTQSNITISASALAFSRFVFTGFACTAAGSCATDQQASFNNVSKVCKERNVQLEVHYSPSGRYVSSPSPPLDISFS